MTRVLGGRYEIGRLLGTGGMAEIFEARDTRLGRLVAVKVLRADLFDPRARERFEREARIAARFNHPNAVTIFDVGEDGARLYFVMELVKGHSLAELLDERGPLDVAEALTIIAPVLAALEAAHASGIIHRDVKPANILLADDGRVKLADFGIAKAMSDATAGLTAPGQIVGTPRYLAPEQVRGGRATTRSDVYSTGIVLYEMLAGKVPLADDTVVATAAGQAHTAVPPLSARRPGLPEWVLHVVGRALASDPAARFTDATSMRSAITDRASTATLTAWASTPVGPDATMVFERPTTQSQPASNFPVGVPETLARERKRRRLIAPVIAASLLGAVVAVSWGLSRSGVDSAAGTTTPPATATAVTTTTKASTTIAPTSTVRTATALTPATVTSTTVSSTTSTPLTTAAPATSAPVTMPQTISGLIQLLEGDPGRYGEFGPELRDRLKLIDKINPRQRGGQDLFDAVDQLSVEVDEWFEDGKLDEDLTDATQDVLFSLVN